MPDIYRVGIEIALVGTVMQGLEAISSKLLGINTKVHEVEGGFKRWALAVGGVASLMAGGAIFKGLEKSVTAGGDLVKQQTLLLNMGVSHADVLETTAKAQIATQKVIGTTIAENVKGIRELMGVMPSLKEAQNAYPSVARAAKVLESLTGTPADQSLQILAKAIELRGGGTNPKTGELDPARFERETEAAVKAIIASGGMVNAQRLLMTMQQAGPMAKMVDSADTFYKGILTAMMDMGGFRAGTALTAVGRQLLGGKMTKPTAEEMERLGLLKPGSWHTSGTGVYVEPGGLTGEAMLKDSNQGISAWFNNVLIPAFANKKMTSNADVQQELYRVFGTETARRLAGLYIQNHAQVARDASLYDNALGGEAYANVAKGDLGANVKNLTDSVQNFLQAFGAPIVPTAIFALQSLANAMNALAGFALAHPEGMAIVGQAMVALAAGLTALGGAAILAAAAALIPGGIIGVAIIGIGTAIAALVAMNWDGVKYYLQKIVDAFNWFIGAIEGIAGKVSDAIHSLGNSDGHPTAPLRGYKGKGGWSPPPQPGKPLTMNGPTHFTVQTAINLDGRQIGRAVSSHIARAGDHPTQAPAFDAQSAYSAPDYNFAMG